MSDNNFISLVAIVLSVWLIPVIIRQIPYFKKKDVVARRLVRAKLPPWILLFELFVFLLSAFLVGFLFSKVSIWLHTIIHPNLPFFSSGVISVSFNSLFDLMKMFIPLIVGVLLGAILGNFISWSVPAIRETEYKISQGVVGASFWEATSKLVRISAIVVPVAVILMIICVLRS